MMLSWSKGVLRPQSYKFFLQCTIAYMVRGGQKNRQRERDLNLRENAARDKPKSDELTDRNIKEDA